MRLTHLLLTLVPWLCLLTGIIAIAEEKPMQLCTPLSTGPCATNPRALEIPSVKFPKPSGPQSPGMVGLDLTVGVDGAAHDIEVGKSPDDEMKNAAIDSAKKWKFAPATYQGKAVAVDIRVSVQFHAVGDPTVTFGSRQASWADPTEVQKLFAEAGQAYGRHDYQAAVDLSRQLIALAPLAKRIRLTLGTSLLELKQYEDAETALQEESKLEPDSPFAYNQLGLAYWRQHKYDDAIAQFTKQIKVTPEAYDAHANLGVLLCYRRKCSAAMPELQKALALSPNQSRPLLAQGECDVDLGNTTNGISEMEQAANQSGSSDSWNQAAYRLAERNVELDRAQAWAETAITIRSAFLRNISLDHVTPTQMRAVNAISSYWDTLGRVYYRKGWDDQARAYIDAAWRLHPSPTKGDHLGQLYEKRGRREDAIRSYAMAVAAADLPNLPSTSPEDLAEARERLTNLLSGQGANIPDMIKQGRNDLEALGSVAVENLARHEGSADFTIKVAGKRILDVRQVAGEAALAPFVGLLQKTPLPIETPEDGGVEILRRGTLRCKAEAAECHFTVLGAEEAFDLATKEANSAKAKSAN